MNYFLIYLHNKEIPIQAQNKASATSEAIKAGILDKFDLTEDTEIFEISEVEYKKLKGTKPGVV